LHFYVGFRVEIAPGIGSLEVAACGDPGDETLAICIVCDGIGLRVGVDVALEMDEEEDSSEHPVSFGPKRAGVIPESAAHSGGKDSIRRSQYRAEGAAMGSGASV
jgi:hypothetical protein